MAGDQPVSREWAAKQKDLQLELTGFVRRCFACPRLRVIPYIGVFSQRGGIEASLANENPVKRYDNEGILSKSIYFQAFKKGSIFCEPRKKHKEINKNIYADKNNHIWI